jgi:hypothetical protein
MSFSMGSALKRASRGALPVQAKQLRYRQAVELSSTRIRLALDSASPSSYPSPSGRIGQMGPALHRSRQATQGAVGRKGLVAQPRTAIQIGPVF